MLIKLFFLKNKIPDLSFFLVVFLVGYRRS